VLRISILNNTDIATFKFEGKLVGLWANELNRVWHSFEPTLGMRKLCLDMRGVTFVDDKGTEVLRRIFRSTGAEILADTPLTRHFAGKLSAQLPRNTRNHGEEI